VPAHQDAEVLVRTHTINPYTLNLIRVLLEIFGAVACTSPWIWLLVRVHHLVPAHQDAEVLVRARLALSLSLSLAPRPPNNGRAQIDFSKRACTPSGARSPRCRSAGQSPVPYQMPQHGSGASHSTNSFKEQALRVQGSEVYGVRSLGASKSIPSWWGAHPSTFVCTRQLLVVRALELEPFSDAPELGS